MPATRPYRPSDRAATVALLGDPRAIDQASHHLHTAEPGPDAGVALWIEPGPGGDPYLGEVKLPAEDRTLFYRLIEACARDAVARGYERASFTVRDRRLLTLIQRDFAVHPSPQGWDPNTDAAVQWEVRVDLRDALHQLQAILAKRSLRRG